jgi:hypothetical protein
LLPTQSNQMGTPHFYPEMCERKFTLSILVNESTFAHAPSFGQIAFSDEDTRFGFQIAGKETYHEYTINCLTTQFARLIPHFKPAVPGSASMTCWTARFTLSSHPRRLPVVPKLRWGSLLKRNVHCLPQLSLSHSLSRRC